MTTEAPTLIHRLSPVSGAYAYLAQLPGPDPDAIGNILDFHFHDVPDLLRRFEQRDWLWLHASLTRLALERCLELPFDITEHRITRVELEEKAMKVCMLRMLAENVHRQHQHRLD